MGSVYTIILNDNFLLVRNLASDISRMNSGLFSFLQKFETFWKFTELSTRSIRGVYWKVVREMVPRNRIKL